MWDNGGAEYSGASTNTMLDAPHQAVLLVGGAAFGSTDRMDEKTAARFWAKVDRRGPDECWAWLGYVSPRGYGRTHIERRGYAAHRVAYEAVVGPIPEGLTLDHLCRNRACVNPAHLEPVTNRENVLRGVGITAAAARATHCPQGHPYAGANLYVQPNGYRSCRVCIRRWRDASHLHAETLRLAATGRAGE